MRYGKAIRVKFDTDLLRSCGGCAQNTEADKQTLIDDDERAQCAGASLLVFCTKVDGRDAQCDKLHGEGIRSN